MARAVHFSAGMHIDDAAELLIEAVADGADVAEGEFNEIKLRAAKGSTVSSILADYDRESEARAKAYRESPAGIAAEAKQAATRASMQERADALMAELPSLDLTDLVAVLDWLDRLQDPSDYIGTRFDREAVIRTFTDAGYVVNANTGDAFRENDRDNHARYLIGQALSCLQSVGAIHGIFGTFHERWKAKFANAAA